MNIIWDYIQTYFQRKHNRKAWRKILKEHTPEEAAEYYVSGGLPCWPHQRKKQMKGVQEALRQIRALKPLEVRIKNAEKLVEHGSSIEEALYIQSLTLSEYQSKSR